MITRADIRLVRSLADKRSRDESRLFVAEGVKLISELLASGLKVRRLYASAEALDALPAASVAEPATDKELERLSLLKSPSSCVAVVEQPRCSLDPAALCGRLVLALDDVQNPGNLGTLIRLADWFGIGDIVCSPSSADCFNPKVVQATMGAILRVRVHYAPLERFLGAMRDAGEPVYGTVLEGGENIYTARLSPHGVLVAGNEGRGISDATARMLTHRIFIPQYPADRCGSESLNVAVATAVACAEFRRRMI